MSSRQLRKLQKQREAEQAILQAEVEEDSEDEHVTSLPPRPKPSLFANLAALKDAEEGEGEDNEKEAAESPDGLSEPEPAPAPKPKKAKKNKKGKKKHKEKPVEDERPENGADEIDAALRELNIEDALRGPSADSSQPPLDPEYERVCALLGISSQHLKVANEMRNLFGRTAVENHDDAGGPVGRGGRRRQRGQNQQMDLETALKGHHAPGKGLSELTLRRNNFIQGKEDWPRGTTAGLTMAVVDNQRTDGTIEFRYAHDQSYQTLQQTFQALVEMGDPQNLIGLLTRNPYHISLLIQVSKIAKDQTDHALSSDLLERALFTFGRASSSAFNTKLSQGKARLQFARPENRELWLAGYQYIKSLVMKGTYRTALEWAKLLLSLDPFRDPYCMRLLIHHLALRAHELNWLLDVDESNFGKLWRDADEGHNPAIYHTSPSLAFAAMQLREGKKSRELLADSMQKVPWLFFRLFKELDLDAPPSIWGIEPRTDAEALFTEIYILQTKDLWNTPEATSLLMEIAHTIPKVDHSTIPTVENSEMTLDVVRFVYLDNTPALMALAPSSLLHRSNNSDADPLPPDVNIFSYDSQKALLQDSSGSQGMGGNFNNPLAAIARMIPGLGRREGENEEEANARLEQIREELEFFQRLEPGDGSETDREILPGEDAGAGEEPVPATSAGILTRILNSLFFGRGDDSDERTDTETDEGSPEVVENGHDDENDEDEDDDEMPDLIPL